MPRCAVPLAVVAVLATATLHAQERRLVDRLDPVTATAVQQLIDSARTAELPTEPLVQKALEGATLGAEYIIHSIRWAHLARCPFVDTTDDRFAPESMSEREALDHMCRIYRQVVPIAERYRIGINIEPHGYFTTQPHFMGEMLDFCDSPFLGMNMDTGNTFIAGHDPVKFLKRFLKKVSHVHVKDVSESLAAALRGKDTGIAVSACSLGGGVNAGNIKKCLAILRDAGYGGVLSIECEGQGGPMIEQSLAWLRETFKELGIKETK